MICCAAGRRIDSTTAKSHHFPLNEVPRVLAELQDIMVRHNVRHVVCSAACGTDLLTLRAALDKGSQIEIFLPTNVEDFLASSVIDRPGKWKTIYLEAIDFAKNLGNLHELHLSDSAEAYTETNRQIIQRTVELAGTPAAAIAIVAWDGSRRMPEDITGDFKARAKLAGFRVIEVRTVSGV
jgi:hypothetical protein